MWRLPESLTTARLELRLPDPEADARPLLAHWASDPEVTRHLLWKTYDPADVPTAQAFLEACLLNWRERTAHRPWMMVHDGTVIGMIGVTPHSVTSIDLGYVMGRAWSGRGLMTEAVTAVVDLLFTRAQTWRVFAATHIANVASQRVLEKAGMQREGTLRRNLVYANLGPVPQDSAVFARVRDQE